jgi:hypothetical protein
MISRFGKTCCQLKSNKRRGNAALPGRGSWEEDCNLVRRGVKGLGHGLTVKFARLPDLAERALRWSR